MIGGLQNPTDSQIKQALDGCQRIAVVGLSPDATRPSHQVAAYLQRQGYEIIPINPTASEILGRACYADLDAVPGPVDVVDVFRRSEHTPPIARQAVAKGAKVLWLQQGVINAEAAKIAGQAGLMVVQDACLKVVHARLRPELL